MATSLWSRRCLDLVRLNYQGIVKLGSGFLALWFVVFEKRQHAIHYLRGTVFSDAQTTRDSPDRMDKTVFFCRGMCTTKVLPINEFTTAITDPNYP